MCVDLRGGQIGVPEKLLYGTQVSPVVQHVGGIRVTEFVRGQIVRQPRHAKVFLQQGLDGTNTKTFADAIHDQGSVNRGIWSKLTSEMANAMNGVLTDWAQTLFVPLASNSSGSPPEIKITIVQAHQFTYPYTTTVQNFQNDPIPPCKKRLQGISLDELDGLKQEEIGLPHRKKLRESLCDLGQGKPKKRVSIGQFTFHAKLKEHANARDVVAKRPSREATLFLHQIGTNKGFRNDVEVAWPIHLRAQPNEKVD
jgi:hypothetical protein